MKINTAFEHLIEKRGWYKICDIKPETARSLKRNYKEGRISTEKMRQLLNAAGYSFSPEKWRVPKIVLLTSTKR